ncbi:MAG: hypothetical protein IJ864_01340 [Alphaproteobacteria bacterium]|nr:hypothetical protein [Alphaproteobacteria bacterium]
MTEDRKKLAEALKAKGPREKGQALLQGLEGCQTAEDVLAFLHDNMSDKDIAERVKHVNDMAVINKYDARVAQIRMSVGNQRNQDVMAAAAQKYCELTGKEPKEFKMVINKDLAKRSNEVSIQQILAYSRAMKTH